MTWWFDISDEKLYKIECEIIEQPINLILKDTLKISIQSIETQHFVTDFWTEKSVNIYEFNDWKNSPTTKKKLSKWSNVDQSVVKVLPATVNNSFALLFCFLFHLDITILLLYSWKYYEFIVAGYQRVSIKQCHWQI